MTCTWTPDFTGADTKWTKYDTEVQERSLLLATSTLQQLTLYRVGTCPETIRPCPENTPPCYCWGDPQRITDRMPWSPILWDGQWYNCAHCGSQCKPQSEIDLPGPVGYIDSIKVDGVELDLDSGDWRIDDGHLVVWQGLGPSPIPKVQNMNLADTEVGTWSITYSRSYPVAADARLAVGYLALEFAEAMAPKGKCSLPRGVTNVVRNGVTFTVDAGLFVNGLTGIQNVDAFIVKWAPPGSPNRSATVFVPGRKTHRTTSRLPRRPVPVSPPVPVAPESEQGSGDLL